MPIRVLCQSAILRFATLTTFFFRVTVRGMEIGITLRTARLAAGLRQSELAEQMGISPQFLSDLEKGRRTFHDRYLDMLPEMIRVSVAIAVKAEYEALARSIGTEYLS
jgi:transcriptional regulator with XRE-family HTH domain